MFEKLYSTFTSVTKKLGEKELDEKELDGILFDLEIALLESDVASEVTDAIKADLKGALIGTRVEKSKAADMVQSSLINSISSIFDCTGRIELFDMINEKKNQGQPFLILFVGINGTGKTTTLAKMAHMLQQAKYSVVVAAADTFRAGAIEQLREHTKRLNLKLVAQNYNSDPAAVARDAVLYAKSHRTDCVLIDTAGRMQTSRNLMEQIAKIAKVVNPDIKIFVGDSLAGNDVVNQAREFYAHLKFDASILTKVDADARGGAALSIAKVTSTPILYVGVGQEYPDLKPFDKKTFLEIVFGKASVEDSDTEVVPAAGSTMATQMQDESLKEESDTGAGGEESLVREDGAESLPPKEISHESQIRTDTKISYKDDSVNGDTKPVREAEDIQKSLSVRSDAGAAELEAGAAELEAGAAELEAGVTNAEKTSNEQAESHNDPFYGINDDDIARYSDQFDVPPPENDADAGRLAERIRRWIRDGRPDKDDTVKDNDDGNADLSEVKNKESELENKDGKPAKKQGMFGFLRRGKRK